MARGRGTGTRSTGVAEELRWRRAIAEHLERRRIGLHECAMLTWLCGKADPDTSAERARWLDLARQTKLSPTRVEALCHGIRRKGYIAFRNRRTTRRRVPNAIVFLPLADDADRPGPDGGCA